ncbi:MAG: lamin tail domain-containing protein [Segetibacter sp.]
MQPVTITKIIDGINGVLSTSNNAMKIKVTCNATKQWTLFRDITGTGTNYVSEGTTKDSTYTTSAFFGYVIKQSTSSFFKKHFFDDIEVKQYIPDTSAPAIQSVSAVTSKTIDVLFTETADLTTAQTITNYFVSAGIGNPVMAVRDETNNALVHLIFATNFTTGTTYNIIINNVKDIAGNTLTNSIATFSFYIPRAFDVVIDEILADPTPVVGLPDAEFIEIKNTSGKDINLGGWKLTSLSNVSSPFSSYTLPADSFLIITGSGNIDLFSPYGKVIGISSFPALNNTETTLSLISKEGVTIHSVSYNNSWFQNDVKSDGGWTLEMIDTQNPCTGANNWKASTDARGGTPGAKNSADGSNPDIIAPALLKAAAIDSVTIILTFSEPVDSSKAANVANYNISEGITPVAAVAIPPAFTKVQLTINAPVLKGNVYTVTANNIADCSGNVIQAVKTARVGLPSIIDSNDIVINEILFNPKPAAVDYVEIYNRSNKIFDLKDLYIANRSLTTNALGSLRQLTTDNILLFPGDFFVISEKGSVVKQNYYAKNPDNFIDVAMPSFPDDEGVVVLLNGQRQIINDTALFFKMAFCINR